jgi:hypothetical protein
MAGGIAQQGYQCGMLWGAALGAGAESYRRYKGIEIAIGMAIKATQAVFDSFVKGAKSPDCEEITKTDWSKRFGIIKYLISGKMVTCFRLASNWAPDALQVVDTSFSIGQTFLPDQPISCASEVIKRMGGSDEEAVMVAGFAGGYGLSGNACGALSAAIWFNTLDRVRQKKFKYSLSDPEVEKIMNAFFIESDYKIECSEICGRKFGSIMEHSEFIYNGGCKKLIDKLAEFTYKA